jgi:2-C-methyl-D-erythritol 2,4-cyclodiphosphate synthase
LLKISVERINLKATTTEGLGWIGEGRGMAATAVVLLEKRKGR